MIFLSHSHHDSNAIDLVQAQMEFRGIQVWRDLNSLLVGQKTEGEISASLDSQAQGILLWLTKNTPKSNFVMNREIMWAKERAAKDPHFDVIPVFVDGDIRAISRKVYDATGWNLDAYNGIKGDSGETETTLARRVAQRCLQTAIAHIARENPHEITIGLQGFHNLPPNARRDLFLKFSPLFTGEREWVPGAWDEMRAALMDLRTALTGGISARQLFIEARIPLSLAYLFGNIFDRQTQFPLAIQQQNQVWSTDGVEDHTTKLDVKMVPGIIGARDVSLEMSFTQPIELHTNAFLATAPFSVARRIQVRVHGYEPGSKYSAEQAHTIVTQLHGVMLRVRGELNPARVHVFGAVPMALAMLLGQRINSIVPTQVYEWDEQSLKYLETVVLY